MLIQIIMLIQINKPIKQIMKGKQKCFFRIIGNKFLIHSLILSEFERYPPIKGAIALDIIKTKITNFPRDIDKKI